MMIESSPLATGVGSLLAPARLMISFKYNITRSVLPNVVSVDFPDRTVPTIFALKIQ